MTAVIPPKFWSWSLQWLQSDPPRIRSAVTAVRPPPRSEVEVCSDSSLLEDISLTWFDLCEVKVGNEVKPRSRSFQGQIVSVWLSIGKREVGLRLKGILVKICFRPAAQNSSHTIEVFLNEVCHCSSVGQAHENIVYWDCTCHNFISAYIIVKIKCSHVLVAHKNCGTLCLEKTRMS